MNVRKYSEFFADFAKFFCHLLAYLNVHERSFKWLIKVQDLEFQKVTNLVRFKDVCYVEHKQLDRLRNISYVTS